jgi:hypothetical protein
MLYVSIGSLNVGNFNLELHQRNKAIEFYQFTYPSSSTKPQFLMEFRKYQFP